MENYDFFKNFKGFAQAVKEIWNEGVLGIDIGSILVAIGIVVFFVLFRKLFVNFFLKRVENFAAKTTNKIDDNLVDALQKPISYVPVIFGFYVAIEYLALESTTGIVAKKLVQSSIVFILFWVLFNLVESFTWVLEKLERIFEKPLIDWLKKIVKGTFVFIGCATILEIWGIRIGPIIAGLGLFGVAVALGAQDLFKNLISGILILAENRFSIGDWIKVEGEVEGTVEHIGFRSTKIRRFDASPVFVPNVKLSDNTVINFSQMTFRRISWTIGLRYDSTIDQLRTVRDKIEEYLLNSEDFVHPPQGSLFVRIDKFNDCSIDFMIYCFTKTTVWREWLEIKEAFALEIKKIVAESGTDFAFPSQSIYVEQPSESDIGFEA
ncbi:MAG: mechanosensitive ion channel family protein [Desulforegulaceae bacterium]|nr:mechanosensitive ion channel family protein [Desulforegulaceae bacterium]